MITLVGCRDFTRAYETLQNELFARPRGTPRHPMCLEVVFSESLAGCARQVTLESAYLRLESVHTRNKRVSDHVVVKVCSEASGNAGSGGKWASGGDDFHPAAKYCCQIEFPSGIPPYMLQMSEVRASW